MPMYIGHGKTATTDDTEQRSAGGSWPVQDMPSGLPPSRGRSRIDRDQDAEEQSAHLGETPD